MSLDPLVRAVLDRTAAFGLAPFAEVGAVGAREQTELVASIRLRRAVLPELASYEHGTLAGRPAVTATPLGDGPFPVVLHLHGGGWVVGSLASYEVDIRRLAADLGAVVVSLDYRLAPEHPWPAAVDDAWAALLELTAAHDRVAVAGDSAGGNLAAVCARRARDAGIALAGQLLVYPATSHARHFPSYDENGTGLLLDRDTMRFFSSCYQPEGVDRTDPDLSPLEAHLAGVAPAVVTVATHDPLRDEGLAYAERLRDAGVPVTVVVAEGQVHGYEAFAPDIPGAEKAVVASRDAFRELLS